MILLILFLSFFFFGWLWAYIAWHQNLIKFKDYKGEFRDVLERAQDYLDKQYRIDFELSISIGDDDRISGLTYSAFGSPRILLNENNIRDTGWIKDFNVIAEIINCPGLANSHDCAVFILFHEFRHIMQDRKICVIQSYPQDDRVEKSIPPYHQKPREADADIFGITNLNFFKLRD